MRARDLEGRAALVTGAGGGIGAAIACALSDQGAEVVVLGRRAEPLQETCARIEAAGGRARAFAADVRSRELLAGLDRLALPIDVLVNNACDPAPYGLLEDVAEEELERVLDSVLGASLRLARALVPGMKARGFGRIVNVGSVAAGVGLHGQVAYAAAKAGLWGLTCSLAAEVSRHGVTCNLVEPGLIDTERIRAVVRPDVRLALVARSAAGRAGTPEEVAAVVAFLASPAASFVTGARIPVSGGLEIGLLSRPAEGS